MSARFIPVAKPLTEALDGSALLSLVSEGWVSGEAPVISEFEEAIAVYCGRTYAVAVNSGTSALDIAFESLDLGPGDEVIVPTFTIISCLNGLLRSGANPIFVDVDPISWNVTLNNIRDKISEKTRLIVVPHIYGLPAPILEIEALARAASIPLLEDAAEGFGLEIGNRRVGAFGDISILSFYANKVLTTGEGGMVLTDDADLVERLRRLRNLGFQPKRRFVHEILGWNFRMPALSAALGLMQVENLQSLVEEQRQRGLDYQHLLAGTPGITLPSDSAGGVNNIYWVFGFLLESHLGVKAQEFIELLATHGVGSRPFFYPLHKQPVLRNYGFSETDSHPVSELLGDYGLYIPSLGTTEADRVRVATVVKEILAHLS